METAYIQDQVVEVVQQPQTTSVVIVTSPAEAIENPSETFATVHVADQKITLSIGCESGGGGVGPVPGTLALEDLTNVSTAARIDGSVLAFDQGSAQWMATNLQRGQLYDGGNF